MLKFTTPLLIAGAMVVAPMMAMAETPELITVQIEYDGDLLTTEAGASKVLRSIKAQARTACTTTSMSMARTVDTDCAETIVAKSASKIVAERDAAGLDTPSNFAKRASILIASLEQR